MVNEPRIASITIVSGPQDLLGDSVICEQVRIAGHDVLFPKAVPGVVEYVAAAHAEAQANELWPKLQDGWEMEGSMLYQPDAGLVFGFAAAAGSAVMSAVVGVEAFANHHLARFVPPGAAAQYDGTSRTLPEFRDYYSIDQRIGEVLPYFYGKPEPKQEPWWSTLRTVQGLAALHRHAVVEPVKRNGLSGEKSLMQRYCDQLYRGAAAMLLDAFHYFEPTWLPPSRLAELPAPPPRK